MSPAARKAAASAPPRVQPIFVPEAVAARYVATESVRFSGNDGRRGPAITGRPAACGVAEAQAEAAPSPTPLTARSCNQ